ncbi:PKD-like domain-containing protein [Flavobacterium indicum]
MIPSAQWGAYPGTSGQIVYFGAESFVTGATCRESVPVTLLQVPCTVTTPPNLVVCDDSSNDGFATFNLDPQTPIALGSNNPANYNVTYHTSLSDANGDLNAISPTNSFTNTVNPQTIYIRLEESSNAANFTTTSFQLQVVSQPTVTISGTASICNGGSTNLTFTGTPGALITYTDGTTNFTLTLDASGNGTVTVSPTSTTTYSLVSAAITLPPGCTNPQSGSVTITVSQQVVGTLSYSPSDFCTTDASTYAPIFTTTTAGSGSCALNVPTYSATPAGLFIDATTGVITPALSLPGTYTVTINYPACGGCAAAGYTTTVTVASPTTSTISYTTPLCTSDVSTYAPTLVGATSASNYTAVPVGLTINSTTGVITPSTSLPGTYTITYLPNGVGACPTIPTPTTVTVTAAPTASISYAGTPYCTTVTASQAVTLTGTNAYTGGTFTSTAGLTLDATTGAIVPSTSVPGTYTVTYTIPASAGCASVPVTTTVTITGAPTATISYAGTPFCNNSTAPQAVTLTGTNAYTGGTFVSTAGLTLDATTGAITPSTSVPGTYTITYTIPASAGCASVPATTTVTVTAAPTASISYAGTPYCTTVTASQAVTLTGTNAYTGGTFTSTAGLTLDATTGAIVPSTSVPGTYTVTYTIPASVGCASVPVTTTVTITGAPTATISYAGTPFCNNSTAPQAVTLTGTNAYTGGTFVSTAGLTLDATTGAITPSTSVPGTYTITYTIPASAGCASVPATTTVTITSLPTATIAVSPATICSGGTSTITFTGSANATITYTVNNGANQTIVLNSSGSATLTTPALTNSSIYTLVSVANGCVTPLSGTVTVNVLPLPTAGITGSTICQNTSGTVTITGTPNATVTYTVNGGLNQTAVIPASGTLILTTPVLTSNSVYQLVSIVSGTVPACSNTLTGSATVVVNPIPVATSNPVGETICSGTSSNINLFSTVAGTTFNWVVTTQSGVSGATNGSGSSIVQTLTATGISNGFVIYTITPTANGCSGPSITVQVNVTPKPVASFTGNLTYCDGDTTAITLNSTIPGTTFTWNVASSNLDTATVQPGSGSTISQSLNLLNAVNTGSVTYTVLPFANNCYGDPISVAIQVNPIPDVVVTAVDDSICSGEMVQINSVSNITGTTFNWVITNQTGAIVTGATSGTGSSINQVITTTSPVASGTVTYQVTPVKNGCVGLPQTIVITVSPRSEIFGVLPQLPICSGTATNIVLGASLPGTTFDWVISSYSGVSGMSAGSGSVIAQTLSVTGNVQGSVTYAVTPSLNGCSGTTVYYTVLVNPAPTPDLEDGHICVNQSTGTTYQTYTLQSGVPAAGHVFEWFFNGSTTPIAGATGPNYTADQAGTYTVEVRDIVTNCEGTATANVTIVYPATSFVTTVTDAFTGNATITVTVTQPGSGNLVYSLDGGAWQDSNVFTNVEAGEHVVAVGDLEGCTYLEDTVLVIDYMNYFTPNGDGYNDRWNIVGLNAQHNAKIYIFDRYGKLIKQIDPLGEGWDGKFNGQDLPSTDYWFSVDYTENEQQKQFKAHFSLKR